MTDRIAELSQHKAARIAGAAYLLIVVAGVLAEFFIRSALIESGNAAATARNIVDSESLFRFSIALDLLMIGADMVVAIALYVVLRPISRNLALLAAFFRLIMDAILGVNLLNLVGALMLVDGTVAGSAFDPSQLQAMALTLIEVHAVGYSIGLVPFGLGTLVVGYLLFKSSYVPRIVAGLLSLAALVYLTGSFIHILAPSFEETFSVAYALPLVAESALALWLVFKGVNLRIESRQNVPAVAS